MSNLSPLFGIRPRQQPNNASSTRERGTVPAAPAPAAPAPADAQPRVAVEDLSVADVRQDLSTASINSLVPINPKLVGQLIVDAGRRRRAELPMSTVAMRPLARAIILSGMRRRAEPLTEADAEFLSDFLAETDVS